MTTESNKLFNAKAAVWDSNPATQLSCSLAYDAILERFPSSSSLDVLEIGCGTGLLSFKMASHIRSLTGVDAAQGMIDAFQIKLTDRPEVKNLRAVCALLEDPDDVRIRSPDDPTPKRFDLVLSHLVLHHIPDIPPVLATMFGCLKSGGRVALTDYADFGPDAIKFHSEKSLPSVAWVRGMKKVDMERWLEEAGFVDVKVETAFNMNKEVESAPGVKKGDMMVFPFLICMGKKP